MLIEAAVRCYSRFSEALKYRFEFLVLPLAGNRVDSVNDSLSAAVLGTTLMFYKFHCEHEPTQFSSLFSILFTFISKR